MFAAEDPADPEDAAQDEDAEETAEEAAVLEPLSGTAAEGDAQLVAENATEVAEQPEVVAIHTFSFAPGSRDLVGDASSNKTGSGTQAQQTSANTGNASAGGSSQGTGSTSGAAGSTNTPAAQQGSTGSGSQRGSSQGSGGNTTTPSAKTAQTTIPQTGDSAKTGGSLLMMAASLAVIAGVLRKRGCA